MLRMDSRVVEDFICKVILYQTSSPDRRRKGIQPATQFPTPALNDWSRSTAFMGAFRFRTRGVKSSRLGIDKIGSKPSSEIGSSLSGSAQSLMRPSRRVSRNASSRVSACSSSGSERCSINWKEVSESLRNKREVYFH